MELLRTDLYRMVWERPVDIVCKELGLSGRGLKKACDRHNIPVPYRGYWAKKAAGHRVPRTPLPDSDSGDVVKFWYATPPEERVPERDDEQRTRVAEFLRAHSMSAADNSVSLKAIKLASKELKRHPLDDLKRLRVEDGAAHVNVTLEQFQRAMTVLDACLRPFAAGGCSVEDDLSFQLWGAAARVEIEELSDKTPYWADVDLTGHYSFCHSRFQNRYFASGRLELRCRVKGNGREKVLQWRDSKRGTVESQVDKVVRQIAELASAIGDSPELSP